MNVAVLLAGIAIAALLFSALLWSIYRGLVTRGKLRLSAWGLAVATLLGMAAISLNLPGLGVLAGLACVAFGGLGLWAEARWSKLLPLAQLLFGVALIVRLPWAGA